MGLVGVLILGFLLYQSFGGGSGDIVNGENNNGQIETFPEGWNRYSNPQFDFTFRYPPEATEAIEAGRVKITYLGPNNTMGSEITDGFTFFVQALETNGQTLSTLATNQFEEDQEFATVVSEPTLTTAYSRDAYFYEVETELGVIAQHVLLESADGEQVFHITYSISGDEEGAYEEMVEAMISTVEADTPVGDPQDTETVSIAVLDTEYEGEPDRGCDQVVLIEREVPETEAPLTAALTELFSIDETRVEGYYNFIANTNETLTFDRAAVESGVASIYLSGELSGLAGVCDDPRAQIQIEETALQFATVESVTLYLNGQPTDLRPDLAQ